MSFLKNTWYVAAHAHELDDELVSRIICNRKVVMYRTSTGEIAALEDRCPHRFVPLSMGKRVGDTLQCGYHGLQFDSSGACVDMPNDRDNKILKPCVHSFPAVERDAVIWLWMGDPDLANPDTIPVFDFLSSDRFSCGKGYSHIKGNYQLLVDNLLDLSHVHYLHPDIHEGSSFSNFTNEVKRDGETIWSMLWRHHYALDENRKQVFGFSSDDVEGQGHARWDVPGVLLVETAFWEHGKSIKEGAETPSAHLLTPETEYTTHYFWASGRTFHLDSQSMTENSVAMMKNVFETQDAPMIEAQQRVMGETTDFLEKKPVILRADTAGVMARRLMKKKLLAEMEEDLSRQ